MHKHMQTCKKKTPFKENSSLHSCLSPSFFPYSARQIQRKRKVRLLFYLYKASFSLQRFHVHWPSTTINKHHSCIEKNWTFQWGPWRNALHSYPQLRKIDHDQPWEPRMHGQPLRWLPTKKCFKFIHFLKRLLWR